MPTYATELHGMQKSFVKGSPGLHSQDVVREALSAALKPPDKKGAASPCADQPWVRDVLYRTSGGEIICELKNKKYKQGFTVSKDGSVKLVGEKVEVQQKTEYEEV